MPTPQEFQTLVGWARPSLVQFSYTHLLKSQITKVSLKNLARELEIVARNPVSQSQITKVYLKNRRQRTRDRSKKLW
ncbi:hypothetical protein [Microseira wollei]|uniref:Uncharacterized protein n=1 Tax=Microseira wollei NIES-4236 TaxID=2530354 RepID=A0AAV3XKI2_9CYAN|nr:hypothetical protein [Microseira wollei]GET40942.1 hypothetical protein MiSe_57540 [Microseira wollei NIES-4236]